MDDVKCPACGAEGKGVKTVTLRSLLRPEKQALISDYRYFFCDALVCQTFYFNEEESRTFTTSDLAVRVGIKEYDSPRPVCYCFDHSVEEIYDEVEQTGKSTVSAEIKKRIAAEGCSCETKNPLGACCLGTVEGVVRAAYDRFGSKESAPKAKGEDKGCCGPGGCNK